jgi:homoserine O-acetyltransferase
MRVEACVRPVSFVRQLTPLTLEAGARLEPHVVAGEFWGPLVEAEAIQRGASLGSSIEGARGLPTDLPTILLVHPLTSSHTLGPEGFFAGLLGKGRPIRPWRARVLSFNLLGSCFGSSGPLDPEFPRASDDREFPAAAPLVRGDLACDPARLPATVTPFDQAASIVAALDALGVPSIDVAIGGSLGGMVVQCLAWCYPSRVRHVISVAAPASSSAAMIGMNHVGREAILRDPSYPVAHVGLSIARQVARLHYRSASELERSQGRRSAGPAHEGHGAWNPRAPYRVASYLRHAGDTFAPGFDAASYVCLSLAMDHHDLTRRRPEATPARLTNIAIDTDTYVPPSAVARVAELFRAQGAAVDERVLASPYGHDGFLVAAGAPLRALVHEVVARG